jgi:predicted XRE-type DNA-binding protein
MPEPTRSRRQAEQPQTRYPENTRITRSSGNIFADLGLPNSEELLLKARIASLISEKIKLQGMSQAEAATRMGTSQPNVSNIVSGRLDKFSLERLLAFVRAFGHDVEIKVRPSKTRNKGRLIMAG